MSVYDSVFNQLEPCPDSILNCKDIRSRYIKEMNELETTGCRECDKLNIKSKYMNEIWKAYMAKLNA
jgi:hypothetical protein